MIGKAVIGIGFGDEGKGITTDFLCSQSRNPMVVRFSGGHQAGHTVVLNGVRHVFSNFGSGTLRGVPTYWSKYCTVNPIGIINEYNKLIDKGVIPKLYIDEKSPITTPYDVLYNQTVERVKLHGSCGVGVGATIEREENYYSLLFGDIFYPSVFKIKLEEIRKYYSFKDEKFLFVDVDEFIKCVELIKENKNIQITNGIPYYLPYSYHKYDELIFEGSQGLLLDASIGFFPHVTRTNVSTKNIVDMGYSPKIYLVTRAYQTRHGNGAMTNGHIPNNIKIDINETNHKNKYQGEFRRAILDLDLLKYAISKDDYIRNQEHKSLVITCLDHVVDEYRFTYQGEIINSLNQNEFVEKISKILKINDIYISETNEADKIKKFKNT